MTGILYLVPIHLDAEQLDPIPQAVRQRAIGLRYHIVENLRTSRRYLKSIDRNVDIDSIRFFEIDKREPRKNIGKFLAPLLKGEDVGLMSEAGCPGIADPGQAIVREAHERGIRVVPLTGPSSIFLALMASGLEGQRFRFHGYLPIDSGERDRAIQRLEKDSARFRETQIFIETPYRNKPMFESLLRQLHPDTLLCIAKNLTGDGEFVKTRRVSEWQKDRSDLHKQPAVFLILQP